MSIEGLEGAVDGLASQIGSIVGIDQESLNPKDDVVIIVGSQEISGWTDIAITRGLEKIPSSFIIAMTEFYPGNNQQVVIKPGSPCQLKIGSDLILTGYVDSYTASIDGSQHTVTIAGRSKCADLVDCAAQWPGGQIIGSNAAEVTEKLADPFGIIVKLYESSPLKAIPQFNIMNGETPIEIIDRICKFSGLLYYDDVDGNLILSRTGASTASSGFSQGVNIQRANLVNDISQRYSEYDVTLVSVQQLNDLGIGFKFDATETDLEMQVLVKDDGSPRVRRKILIADPGSYGRETTHDRAKWERSRRAGRSWQVNLTTDTWRTSDGKLLTPNTLVPLNVPSIKINSVIYAIGAVTYRRSMSTGTVAELQLMPQEAYQLEPVLIQPTPFAETSLLTPPSGHTNPANPSTPVPATSPALKSNAPYGQVKDGTPEGSKAILDLFGDGSPGVINPTGPK